VIAQLGKVFGFYPDEKDEFNGMQIVLSIADMHSDGRAPFHPVALMGSYYDQIEEAKVISIPVFSTIRYRADLCAWYGACRWRWRRSWLPVGDSVFGWPTSTILLRLPMPRAATRATYSAAE
jgi:hypothetical protein